MPSITQVALVYKIPHYAIRVETLEQVYHKICFFEYWGKIKYCDKLSKCDKLSQMQALTELVLLKARGDGFLKERP